MRELVGPIIDIIDSKKNGLEVKHVMSKGFIEVSNISIYVKLIFFFTNLPFYLLASEILFNPMPNWTFLKHVLLASGSIFISIASTLFHGSVLFGIQLNLISFQYFKTTTVKLLYCDIFASYLYSIIIIIYFGILKSLYYLLPAFFIFSIGNWAKFNGFTYIYSLLHGLWHIYVSIALWYIIYN